ncbi:hypothetical protein ACLOJK_015411 [Asimina triloba]
MWGVASGNCCDGRPAFDEAKGGIGLGKDFCSGHLHPREKNRGLIRDVICLIAEEHEFAVSSSADDVRAVDGVRRISIKNSSSDDGSPDMELKLPWAPSVLKLEKYKDQSTPKILRLEKLETLDLKRTQFCSLPPAILRLQCLGHLLIGGIQNNGVLIPKRIGKLKQVKTMKRVVLAKDGVAAELGSLNLSACI